MKISRTFFSFIVICFIIFVGAFSRNLTYLSIGGVPLVVLAMVCSNIRRSYVDFCNGIVLLLAFQNLCIGLGAHICNYTDTQLKLLTQIPFLVIVILWLLLSVLRSDYLELDVTKVCFYALLICIAISSQIGFGGFQASAVTVRNLTVFYMAYSIGKHSLKNEKDINIFIRFIVSLAMFMCVVGFLMMWGGYDIYKLMGIHEVYIAKAAPFDVGRLDGRFYTSLISKTFIRMGSIYYEPVNLAYFLGLAFICCILKNPWKSTVLKILSTGLVGLGLMLTFGKGGYLIVAIALACIIGEKFLTVFVKGNFRGNMPKVVASIAVIGVAMFVSFYAKYIGGAIMPHIWGIIGTWKNVLLNPIGYGLGMGGNAAQVLGDVVSSDSWLSTGGETALMSFMYQIGIQGVFAFSVCLISMSYYVNGKRVTLFERVFFYLPLILLGISLLQDNTFTPQCVVPYMLLQGGMKNYRKSMG